MLTVQLDSGWLELLMSERKMRFYLHLISLICLTILCQSCDFCSVSEPDRNSIYDSRNPNVTPEILDVYFFQMLSHDSPATVRVDARATSQIRLQVVDDYGDPLTTSFREYDPLSNFQLPEGEHLIAGQARSIEGAESHITYWPINVELRGYGTEKTFLLPGTAKEVDMVWIPGGSFQMGGGEIEVSGSTLKRHQVILSYGFWIGKYEVTEQQWNAVVSWEDFRYGGNSERPAANLSWFMVQDSFMVNLNSNESKELWRLPTEAEWEYACTGGVDSSLFWWGDNYELFEETAWYYDNSEIDDILQPHDVGLKLPNPWGLHDVLGNVSEWCSDWYSEEYDASRTDPEINPKGPPDGSLKLYRGGNYSSKRSTCLPTGRGAISANISRYKIGFRLVRDAD